VRIANDTIKGGIGDLGILCLHDIMVQGHRMFADDAQFQERGKRHFEVGMGLWYNINLG